MCLGVLFGLVAEDAAFEPLEAALVVFDVDYREQACLAGLGSEPRWPEDAACLAQHALGKVAHPAARREEEAQRGGSERRAVTMRWRRWTRSGEVADVIACVVNEVAEVLSMLPMNESCIVNATFDPHSEIKVEEYHPFFQFFDNTTSII